MTNVREHNMGDASHSLLPWTVSDEIRTPDRHLEPEREVLELGTSLG
jgi:hypothetical protein